MRQSVKTFIDALLAIDRVSLGEMVAQAGADDALLPIEDLVVPALEDIGEQWERGEVSLSQVYMSGRLCEELITGQAVKWDGAGPQADSAGSAPHGAGGLRIAISTLDDYHVLGKRIVCSVLRASGYRVSDYGTADAAGLAERVVRDQIQVLLLSVLMLPSALRVKELRAALDAAGQHTHLIVGGAPFRLDPGLWREVGADAAGASAADALALVCAAESAFAQESRG